MWDSPYCLGPDKCDSNGKGSFRGEELFGSNGRAIWEVRRPVASSGSDAMMPLAKKVQCGFNKSKPQTCFNAKDLDQKSCAFAFLLLPCATLCLPTKIKITCHRGSVNWTAGWQRGGYWDTGRINDLSLFIKKCTAMWKTYLSLHPSGPFHLRFTCCTREAL